MTLTIHHLHVSQSERIVWLAEELGLTYDLKLHTRDPVFSPQSLKDVSPLDQSPVIVDGGTTLGESAACAEYIIYKLANGHMALPPSHPNYADYLWWFHFANGNLQPQLSRMMMLKFAGVADDADYPKRMHAQMDKYLTFMDKRLGEEGVEWLAGKEFTAADCMNVFTLTTMRTFYPLVISKYGNVLAWLKRCTEREGYKRYRSKGDPDLPLMIEGKAPEQFIERMRAEGKL